MKLTVPVGDPIGEAAVSVTVAVHVVDSVARSPGGADGEQATPVVVVSGTGVTVIIWVPLLAA